MNWMPFTAGMLVGMPVGGLLLVDALERGTFWGVLCTPQPQGVPR